MSSCRESLSFIQDLIRQISSVGRADRFVVEVFVVHAASVSSDGGVGIGCCSMLDDLTLALSPEASVKELELSNMMNPFYAVSNWRKCKTGDFRTARCAGRILSPPRATNTPLLNISCSVSLSDKPDLTR